MTIETRQDVRDLVLANNRDAIIEAVTEWCNAREVTIDTLGDIWIADPQHGHWLNDDAMVTFGQWVRAHWN